MLSLTQQWGTHAKAPSPNPVLINPRHVGPCALHGSYKFKTNSTVTYKVDRVHIAACSLQVYNQAKPGLETPTNLITFIFMPLPKSTK